MKAVADTLAVARSNLIELVSRRAKSRRPYRKAGDNELLALIRRLVDERPTYGYRRIRRLINRQRKANGKPPVNGKRVLRIMQANKLTLERHTGRRPGRTHDGVRQSPRRRPTRRGRCPHSLTSLPSPSSRSTT